MKKKKNTPEEEEESPGKFMIAVGGLGGFSVGFFASYLAGNKNSDSLLAGMIGCIICAFLLQRLAVYLERHVDRIRHEKVRAEKLRRRQREIEDLKELEEGLHDEENPEEAALGAEAPQPQLPGTPT